jgi:uncharacterized protein YjiS (DUF1127 family)
MSISGNTAMASPPLVSGDQLTHGGLGKIIVSSIAGIFRLLRTRLHTWNSRLNDRAFLASLQEFQLTEMGLSLDQRDSEVNKPFWKR